MQSHREGVRQDKNEDKTRAKKKKGKIVWEEACVQFWPRNVCGDVEDKPEKTTQAEEGQTPSRGLMKWIHHRKDNKQYPLRHNKMAVQR